jgi:hypothetical protein
MGKIAKPGLAYDTYVPAAFDANIDPSTGLTIPSADPAATLNVAVQSLYARLAASGMPSDQLGAFEPLLQDVVDAAAEAGGGSAARGEPTETPAQAMDSALRTRHRLRQHNLPSHKYKVGLAIFRFPARPFSRRGTV